MRDRVLLWLILGVVVAAYVTEGILAHLAGGYEGGDTAVYQAGAEALLRNYPLYEGNSLPFEPDYAKLPFTYTPFAALVFTPLVIVPPQVAWGILNAFSALALIGVVYVVLRKVPRRPEWLSPAWGAVIIGVLLLETEPVRVNLGYGQINILLMALVVLDVLVISGSAGRAGRFGGVLVGVAAAIKLVPLIFVVHLLLTGRKKDAARAVATFAGLQVLMLLISPRDAIRFWTHTVFDSSRIGPTQWSWNQSLAGMVRRFSEQASWSQPVAYVIGAVLAVGGVILVRRYADRPVHALLITGFLALLISPVSWLHHWVWIAPLIALLVAEAGFGNRIARRLLPVTVLLFTVPILRWVTHGFGHEYHWNPVQMLFGNAFILFPVIVGIVLLAGQRRDRQPARVG